MSVMGEGGGRARQILLNAKLLAGLGKGVDLTPLNCDEPRQLFLVNMIVVDAHSHGREKTEII